jgi:hypothetical protein
LVLVTVWHKRVLLGLAVGVAAIVTIAGVMASGFAGLYGSTKSTDLSPEAVNGIGLTEKVNQATLERVFGTLTSEGRYEEGIRTFFFEYSAYSVSVSIDESERVTGVSAGFVDPSGPRTSRGIGPGSSLSDVASAYGENYRKESYSNFMGSGNHLVLYYTDREHGIVVRFEFYEGDPNQDKATREWRLYNIWLHRS